MLFGLARILPKDTVGLVGVAWSDEGLAIVFLLGEVFLDAALALGLKSTMGSPLCITGLVFPGNALECEQSSVFLFRVTKRTDTYSANHKSRDEAG